MNADDLNSNPEARDLNGVTLWEALEALEGYERSEGRICTANVIARAIGTLRRTTPMTAPRPYSEWTEEDGNVLWWRFPIEEAPYCGSPNDVGRTCLITLNLVGEGHAHSVNIGGWPGYHTHWTPLPEVREP